MRHGGRYIVAKPGGKPKLVERTREAGAAAAPPLVKPKGREARVAAIKEEIYRLDLGEDANVTEDGKASATALTDILGWRVTVRERDEAWDAIGADQKAAVASTKE